MKINTAFVIIALAFSLFQETHARTFSDSASRQSRQKRSTIRFTTRLHSLGFFSYAGRIACENPSFDLNFTLERKNWGYMVFKAVDLYDGQSHNNFLLSALYKNIRLGNRLTITPYTGVVLEQLHQVADHGSDAIFILVTAVKLSDRIKIDNTTIFSNVVLEREMADWINRIRVLYSCDHTDVTLFTWHNNRVLDASAYLSFGLSAAYSRIKMADRVALSTGITGIVMAKTSDPEKIPQKNGIVFTVAVVFE